MFLTVGAASAADAPLGDLVGGKDPPHVGRFAGSTIVGYGESGFDEATFPLTNEVDGERFVKAETIEGKITRVAYLAPSKC